MASSRKTAGFCGGLGKSLGGAIADEFTSGETVRGFLTIEAVLVSDFDFDLPPEQIAQEAPLQRGSSRMLVLERASGRSRDSWFQELPELLNPGDVLVLNDSRVIPARLFGRRVGPGANSPSGTVEVLLTEPIAEGEWRALVRPGRKVRIGQQIVFMAPGGGIGLAAEVTGEGEFGERVLRFTPADDFFFRLEQLGHMPLPPYIRRPDRTTDRAMDRERYQTVFARARGSVAAPTAGLHFTPQILDRIRARGVHLCSITLHVGLGTFQPVRVAEMAAIELHSERYELPAKTAEEVDRALREGRRILAAGTTVVRTLEHCAQIGRLEPHAGVTNIFLRPGSPFRLVSGLLTNFHLPQSTLLMLVSAFAGKDPTLEAYRHAVAAGYRFFSYGDCMFIA